MQPENEAMGVIESLDWTEPCAVTSPVSKAFEGHLKDSHLAVDLALKGGPDEFVRRLDDDRSCPFMRFIAKVRF